MITLFRSKISQRQTFPGPASVKVGLFAVRRGFRRRLLHCLLSPWNVPLVLVAAILWANAAFEDSLYDSLVMQCTRPEMSEREKVTAIADRVYELVGERAREFGSNPALDGFHFGPITSGDKQLLCAGMACGSYSGIFVEACHRAGISARLCQLICDGGSSHILAEAFVDGKWAVVDSMFRQVFVGRDGSWAGLAEISRDWDYFRGQSPDYERHELSPGQYRYTNWGRSRSYCPWSKPASIS